MKEEKAIRLYEEKCVGKNAMFKSYYKYRFSFTYEDADVRLWVSFGGCADDIYRADVSNFEKLPATLNGLKEEYNMIILKEKKTGDTYEWDDI